jgi:hypothetical protein
MNKKLIVLKKISYIGAIVTIILCVVALNHLLKPSLSDILPKEPIKYIVVSKNVILDVYEVNTGKGKFACGKETCTIPLQHFAIKLVDNSKLDISFSIKSSSKSTIGEENIIKNVPISLLRFESNTVFIGN